jgi:hypothetical protein
MRSIALVPKNASHMRQAVERRHALGGHDGNAKWPQHCPTSKPFDILDLPWPQKKNFLKGGK